MVAVPSIEVDVDADEDADDDLPLSPQSFFSAAGDELVDAAVCARVYRIYLRESGERGFIEPAAAARELARSLHADADVRKQLASRASLAPYVAPAPAPPSPPPLAPPAPALVLEEDVVVALSAGQGESTTRTEIREAHRVLAKKLGRVPSALELYEHLGDETAKSISNVRQGAKRAGLELTSQRGGGEPRTKLLTAPAPRSSKQPRALVAREPEPVVDDAASPPSGGTGAYLAIMALQAERGRLQSQLDAVDAVIERLRA